MKQYGKAAIAEIDAKVSRNVNLSGDIADISGVSQDVSDDSSNKAEEAETDGLGI